MTEAERIWREKSDEELLNAVMDLEGFTEEGRRVILAEIERRGLELPDEEDTLDAGTHLDQDEEADEPLECLRCDVELRYLGTKALQPDAGPGALGELADLFEHGHVDVFMCPRCGKIELFAGGPPEENEEEGES